MASKVLIKLPAPTFASQLGTKDGRAASDPTAAATAAYGASDPLLRVAQLEQNIKYLQEQHRSMLAALHDEVDSLRIKNRDLQFQLIFGNSPTLHQVSNSADSSPEEVKAKVSPQEVNTSSLQVEMLEREVAELRTALTEAEDRNAALTQRVEQLNKQVEQLKKEQSQCDASTRLEDADALIKKLLRENEDQRKEMSALRAHSRSHGGGRGGGQRRGEHHPHGGMHHHTAGPPHHQQQRFPPLQGHGYWPMGFRNSNGNQFYSSTSDEGGMRRKNRGKSGGHRSQEDHQQHSNHQSQ